jgi:hypothetical protein
MKELNGLDSVVKIRVLMLDQEIQNPKYGHEVELRPFFQKDPIPTELLEDIPILLIYPVVYFKIVSFNL